MRNRRGADLEGAHRSCGDCGISSGSGSLPRRTAWRQLPAVPRRQVAAVLEAGQAVGNGVSGNRRTKSAAPGCRRAASRRLPASAAARKRHRQRVRPFDDAQPWVSGGPVAAVWAGPAAGAPAATAVGAEVLVQRTDPDALDRELGRGRCAVDGVVARSHGTFRTMRPGWTARSWRRCPAVIVGGFARRRGGVATRFGRALCCDGSMASSTARQWVEGGSKSSMFARWFTPSGSSATVVGTRRAGRRGDPQVGPPAE